MCHFTELVDGKSISSIPLDELTHDVSRPVNPHHIPHKAIADHPNQYETPKAHRRYLGI